MGRKMKKAATIAMAGMLVGIRMTDISVAGSSSQSISKDKVPVEDSENKDKNPGEDSENEDKNPGEESESEDKNPGEGSEGEDKDPPEESETEEKDLEDTDKKPEKEEIKSYRTEYDSPDGENGYYLHFPEGRITHLSKRGVTKYCLKNGQGSQMEGMLEKENAYCLFEQMEFTEGKNNLEIWMEDEEGNFVDNSKSQREFLIDSARPMVNLSVAGGTEGWHKDEAELQVEASDGVSGSQIAEIICKTGEKVIGKGYKEIEKFQIQESSKDGESIPITVIVRDNAGNQTTQTEQIYIDKGIPAAVIQGVQDYMITSKPVQVDYLAEEENALGDVRAGMIKERPDGQKEETEVKNWKAGRAEESGKIEKRSSQILTEDGLYKIRMDVTDQAGHESHTETQLIIDTENPVIAHIDELDGKYLKYFSWEFPVEESVKDFTSYSYTMKMDNSIYHPGERIDQEGIHTLSIQAVDSAGNQGVAKARFTIDHTPPVIKFENVKEGESYEKEREFYVRTGNAEDQIEYVKINGKKQKSEKQKDVYEYKINEVNAYEVEVKARDLAGNEKVSRIGFQIEPERNFFQKIADPVKNYILYGKDKEAEKNRKEGEKSQYHDKTGKRNHLWTGFSMLGILGMTGIYKKEKIKELFEKKMSKKNIP